MPVPFDPLAGHWWRFDRYEIRDGYLCPGKGAVLRTYDPWELFRESRTARGGDPPYQTLLNLVQDLSLVPRPGPGLLLTLKANDAARVVGWCQQFGLLGLLPHQTLLASLAPRWEPMPSDPGRLVATQLQFTRTVENWMPTARTGVSRRLESSSEWRLKPGAPVSGSHRSKSFAPVGALFRPLHDLRHQHKPLAQTWARFFPEASRHVGESYPYPAPLSEAFWRSYAEPVDEFVAAGRLLLDTLRVFEAKQTDPGIGSTAPAPSLGRAKDAIHGLIETVRPTMALSVNGMPRQEWLATSLLGALAMMAFLDLTESRRVMMCQTCRKIFVSKAYQAAYCSITCRNTAQKRKYRAKRKQLNHKA